MVESLLQHHMSALGKCDHKFDLLYKLLLLLSVSDLCFCMTLQQLKAFNRTAVHSTLAQAILASPVCAICLMQLSIVLCMLE